MKKIYISDYVKLKRATELLSTREFGKKYGISKAQVSKYENKQSECKGPYGLTVAIHFCKTFNIPLKEFADKFYCSNDVKELLSSYNDFSNIKHTKSIDKEISLFTKYGIKFLDEKR